MNNDTVSQFKNELNTFFVLVLMNLVFGALAMAFGMQFMVTSVLGMTDGQTTDCIPDTYRIVFSGMLRARVFLDTFQREDPARGDCSPQGS